MPQNPLQPRDIGRSAGQGRPRPRGPDRGVVGVASPLSRRSLLLGMAGVTLAGCRATLPFHRAAVRRGVPETPVEFTLWGSLPDTVVAAFERAHPHVRIHTGSFPTGYRLLVGGSPSPATFADMTSALRKLNFNGSVLFPGTLAASMARGRNFGVPVSVVPLGCRPSRRPAG